MDQLEMLRNAHQLPDEQGIALVPVEDGQLSLAAVTPEPEDEIVERDGTVLMVVPNVLAEPMGNMVLDYVETPEMQGFTLSQNASESA